MNGSYISNYRALNPSATQGKTDLEIALALLAADPTLALRVPEIGRLKKQADDRESIRSGAAYGKNIAASNINATAQKAQQQLGERGWIERAITDPTKRGLLMAEQADLLMNDLQIGKGLTREKVRKLTEIRDKMDAIRASPEFREFQEAEGFKEGWSEFWGWSETPTIISEVVTESMSALLSYGAEKIFGGAAAGAGTGAALGAAGGPVAPATATAGAVAGAGYGAMAGLGLTSYGLAASSKYMQALEETVGSEVMDNPDLLFEAMKDPEIHKKANAKAKKYGVPIAAIDTISAGMAGRSIAWGRKLSSSAYTKASKIPAESLLQQTAKQGLLGTAKAAPKAVPLGFQMAMGSGGETLGQLSSEGKVENWKDVFIEGIAELGMAPFEMSASKIGEAMTPDMHKALNDRIRIKRKQGVTSDEQKESIDGFVKEGTLTAQQAEIYKDHVDSVYAAEFEGRTPPEEEGAKGGMSKKDAAEIVNAFIRGEITEEGLAVRASETEGSEPVKEEFIIGPSDANFKRFKELVAEDAKSGEDKAGEYAKKNNIEIRELTKEENRQLSNEGLKLEAVREGGYKLDTDGVIGTEPDRPRNVGDKSPEEIKAGAAEAKEKSASNRSFKIFSQHGITEPNPSLESLFGEGRDEQLSAVESIIQTTDDKVTKSDMKDEVAALGDLLSPRERDLSLAFIDNQQFDTTPDDLPFAEWSAASLDETGFLIRSQAEEGAVHPEVKVIDPDAIAPSEMTWEENWRRKNNISPDEPLPDYAKILMAQESRWRADMEAQYEAATKARKATETMPKSDLPLFGGALDVDPSVQSEKQSASKSIDQASFDKKKMAELRSRESEIFNRIYFTPQSIRLGGLFGDEVIPAEGNVGVEVTDAERSALKKELVSIEDQIVSLGGRIDPTGTQASGVHPIYNKEITNELTVEDFGLFAVKSEKHHRTGEKISRLDIWRMTALSAARHYANIFEAPPLQQPIEDVAWDAFTVAVQKFYERIQNHKERGRPDIMDLGAVGDLYKWSGKKVIWDRVKDAADSQGSALRRITPPQGRHDRKKGRTIQGEHTRMGRDWMAPRTLGIAERISEAAEEIANDYLESVELGGESQMVPKTVEGGDPVPIVGVTEPTGSRLRTPESIRLVEEAKDQLAKFISDFMDRVMSKGFTQKDAPAWTAGAFEREVFETILLQATANAIRVRNRANRNLIGKRRKLNSVKGRVRRIRATLGHLHGTKLRRIVRFLGFRTDPAFNVEAVKDDSVLGGWTYKVTTTGSEQAWLPARLPSLVGEPDVVTVNESIKAIQDFYAEQGVYNENADVNIKLQQGIGGRPVTVNLRDFIGELRAQNNILSQEIKNLEKQIAKAEAQPDLATRGFRLPASKAEAGAPRSVPKAIRKLLNDYNKQREAMELTPLEMPKRFVSEYMLGDKKNKSSAHNIMLRNIDAVLREMQLWDKGYGKWDMDEVAANMDLVDRTFAEDSVEQVGDLLDKHPLTAEGRGTHTVSEAIDKVLAANPKLKGTYSDSVINFTKSIADRLGIGIHLAEIKHTRTKADGTSETKYRAAVYLSSTDQIAVYPKVPEEVLLKSLIEETMHAVAVNGIMNDRDLSNEAKSLYQDAKEAWEREMAQAQQTIDKSELGSGDEMINAEIAKNRLDELRSFSYAFSNHWEFLAHGLYQVDLQKWLNSRGRKAGIATSWWNRFKDMIMRALDSFGETIEAGSYLAEVLDMNAKGLAERLDWQEGADATNADPNTIEGRFIEPASQNWKGNDVVLTQYNLKYDTNLLETMDIEHQGRTIHKGIKVLNQNPESANKPAKSIEEKWAPINKILEDDLDAEYLKLASDPEANMSELQRMVDEAAKAAGYTIGPVIHYTSSEFNVFQRRFDYLKGFYFADTDRADMGLHPPELVTDAFSQKPLAGHHRRKVNAYLSIKNPLITAAYETIGSTGMSDSSGIQLKDAEELQNAGYDGVIAKESDGRILEYVVFEPNQIKSADPITRDEAGNIIPLSQRFDDTSDSMLFAEGDFTPETSGKETLEGIKSKIETPEGREGVIRSEMSMYEKFREKFITSGAILDTFQSAVFKALNIAGKTRVALSELFELQAGSPVKADHRTNNFMLRIHDKIGGSSKNESNFNVYALIRRIEDRITHDDDPNLEAKIDELMANMDSESGAWTGTEEQKLDLINLITKSKEVGDFKKLADLPKLGLALDEFVNEINDPNLIRFVRDEDGEIVRANGVARTEGAFEDAIGVYQEEMASGLYDLYRADIISGTSYNRISRSSSFYMPFYVVKYFNQDPKDTFGEFIRGIKTEDFGLISALDAAQFKLYNTQLRIDRNAFMQELERFRTDFDPDETFMRKTKTLDERVMPSNMKPVKWHENGKNRYLWIDEDVADVLTRFDPVSTSMTYDVMKRAGDIFKMGATGVNVFFQAGNMLLLDPVRLLTTSKGGLRAMDKGLNPFVLAMQYLRAIGASSWANLAPNSVKNLIRRVRPDFGRDADALYDEFINSGAAGSTIAEYLGKATAIKDPITRYNRKSKLNWMLAKANQVGKAMEQTAKLVGLQRMKVFEGIDDLADRIDSATGAKKVALQNEMKDRMRAISVEIRNFAGSPDFMRKGKFTENEALNVLFLFFNARVQGVERDLNRLSKVFSSNPQDRKLGAGVMLKMTAFAAMPTAIAWALNRRDEDRERDYAEVSDEEKKRYFMIPLDSFFEHPYIEGKMVRDYIRIPRRESFGLFSYTIEKGLDHMYDKDPAAVSEILTHWAESTFPINIHGIPEGDIGKGIESMASNLNPILRAPAELIGNRNFFRRKPIVPISMQRSDPSEQYYNTTPEIYKGYGISPLKIKHTLEALTAGGITQFLPPKDVGDGGVGRRIASAPLISRLARSTFLAEDEITEIMDDADMMDATARVIRRRAVSKFMTDTRGLSIQDRVRAIPPATNNDERLRNEGIIRRLREIALGLDDDEIRMKNSTVNVRSSVIVSRIQDMTPAEVKVYLTDLANKRILTRDVGRDLALKLHARGESIHDYLREPVR